MTTMITWLTFVLFAIGFPLLIKGADWLVDGASSLAKRFNVSDIVIGLTVVAFGTSAPELAVNLISAINGTTDLAVGNVLGSNIANILLILGVSAVIYPLVVHKNTVWKEIPLALLAVVVVAILANDAFFNAGASMLSMGDGLILIAFFVIFIYYTFGIAKSSKEDAATIEADTVKVQSLGKSILFILLGLLALVFGGNWIVEGATAIARGLGWSEAFIGLTIVAIGTSLPELATSATAAMKKETDIAIGNVVGSNIFNIFWILGLSAVVRPVPLNPVNNFDLLVLTIVSSILFLILFVGKKHSLDKWKGVLFILGYIAYVVYLVMGL